MVSDTIENLLTLVYSVLIQYYKLTIVCLEYCIKTECPKAMEPTVLTTNTNTNLKLMKQINYRCLQNMLLSIE